MSGEGDWLSDSSRRENGYGSSGTHHAERNSRLEGGCSRPVVSWVGTRVRGSDSGSGTRTTGGRAWSGWSTGCAPGRSGRAPEAAEHTRSSTRLRVGAALAPGQCHSTAESCWRSFAELAELTAPFRPLPSSSAAKHDRCHAGAHAGITLG